MRIQEILLLAFGALAECSLLEMSQMLWERLLVGGLTKGGPLDPLRIPVVKVDQSEGNTSYRIVLRNVEIRGLNFSTLESVHIAKGRLRSNLSESEAGYVSYTDLRELDSIRYRFHTLIKEPKSGKETEGGGTPSSRNYSTGNRSSDNYRNGETGISVNKTGDRDPLELRSHNSEARDEIVDVVYARNFRPFEIFYSGDQRKQDFNVGADERKEVVPAEDNIRTRNPSRNFADQSKEQSGQIFRGNQKFRNQEDTSGLDDAHVSASESFDIKQTSVKAEQPRGDTKGCSEFRHDRKYGGASGDDLPSREAAVISGANRRQESRGRSEKLYRHTENLKNNSRINYDTRPSYVDIVYADNDDKTVKHFAGFRRRDDEELEVYGIEEVRKDLEQHNRYIVHNFTEAEAVYKRNNITRVAAESKRLQDLVRYAEKFQEKQGYYEQGMQLIYHFGGIEDLGTSESLKEPELNEAKRRKREHNKDDIEDDIIHVIVELRVPMLKVKADYLLTGKVGKEILRGNGLLTGNFTDLTGNFTLELKKVGEKGLVVRAARAILVANHRKVSLQGMNEKGPIESILVHGLMAAEAVAAMIVDDLATKALSENPPTDAMIYKMYSNEPVSS